MLVRLLFAVFAVLATVPVPVANAWSSSYFAAFEVSQKHLEAIALDFIEKHGKTAFCVTKPLPYLVCDPSGNIIPDWKTPPTIQQITNAYVGLTIINTGVSFLSISTSLYVWSNATYISDEMISLQDLKWQPNPFIVHTLKQWQHSSSCPDQETLKIAGESILNDRDNIAERMVNVSTLSVSMAYAESSLKYSSWALTGAEAGHAILFAIPAVILGSFAIAGAPVSIPLAFYVAMGVNLGMGVGDHLFNQYWYSHKASTLHKWMEANNLVLSNLEGYKNQITTQYCSDWWSVASSCHPELEQPSFCPTLPKSKSAAMKKQRVRSPSGHKSGVTIKQPKQRVAVEVFQWS